MVLYMNKQLQRLIEKMNKIKAQGERAIPYYNAIKHGVQSVIDKAEVDNNLTPSTVRQLKTLQTCILNAIQRRIDANSVGEIFEGDAE